ncbi:DUF58 domain-containing protein [Thiomicrorhabdus sediminis]|uniref:DUF58 domain-containing protein n=1 Tax=Thiomicrorhabdus sediminis TaxID=2580412 RepID=A0A4P9K2Z6_9GAMM|nr:DUF58 domain-containing protein [Thiomicrorhabdus sediminis]QCU89199.1 DUF58 domain-containing protein [Thiomicrorhabdus sediminis]
MALSKSYRNDSFLQLLLKAAQKAFNSLLALSKNSTIHSPLTKQPVMDTAEIIRLAERLEQISGKVSANLKQSEAMRQGEQTSRFMGAGLEYEESRLYQPGDEIRRINWRLMARTGQAYTKLFQEERQENWFILVDHRATMRFGSRKRLKATQAVRVAGYYAWLAQQQGLPLSCALIGEGLQISPSFEGKSSYMHVMQHLSQPCPPLSAQQSRQEPRFNDILIRLKPRLMPGTRLLIISDFHDIDNKTSEILTAMQDQVAIKAVWIRDAVENRLPNVEGLQLQSIGNAQTYQLSGQQAQQQYQEWSKQQLDKNSALLQQANCKLYLLAADSDLTTINQALNPLIWNAEQHTVTTQA